MIFSAYDLACSVRDVRTVQKFLFDQLNAFRPAAFHLLLTSFPWAGILTTNYDLIIERAYGQAKSPLQRLVPNVKDEDGATQRLDHRSLLYVKRHGCITRHHEVHPPLIASTEQLIAFREGRQGQFDTFLEWAKTKTLIFAGYAFLDSDLRLLFDQIIREGDNRPRHYIVNRNLLPLEEAYWRDRRVVALNLSFEEFLNKLDSNIAADKRAIGVLAVSSLHKSTFTRFITTAGGSESEEWPAPGLDDTQLSKSGLPLELHRAQITDRRVSAFRVVEALDIVKHVCLCFIARPVRFIAGALGLQRREEALHRSVVPHVA